MQRPAEDQDAVSYERMSVISGEKMEGNGLQIKYWTKNLKSQLM